MVVPISRADSNCLIATEPRRPGIELLCLCDTAKSLFCATLEELPMVAPSRGLVSCNLSHGRINIYIYNPGKKQAHRLLRSCAMM
jgi:hypothetical protein